MQRVKFRVLQILPLKMNLVLEILMDRKDGDNLPSAPPLFPKLPHPLHHYSIARFTF
jgi:hypothetical protein